MYIHNYTRIEVHAAFKVGYSLWQVQEPATFDLCTLGLPLWGGAEVLLQLFQWGEGRGRRSSTILNSLHCIRSEELVTSLHIIHSTYTVVPLTGTLHKT